MIKRLICLIMAAMLLSSCTKAIDEQPPAEGTTEATTDASDKTSDEIEKESLPEPSSEKVVAAYLTGDLSQLTGEELTLLGSAAYILGEIITPNMTQFDMCIAIHDYIVTHGTYDKGELSIIGQRKEYSHIAYGFLTEGEGICSGYTDTFKLLADMLRIENIIVEGTALDSQEHAWNMVKLNDKWYHIDCTWDDFVPDEEGRPPFHIYTLVNDAAMEANSHVWDRDAYPEATDSLNYFEIADLWFDSNEDITAYVTSMRNGVNSHCEVAYPVGLDIHVPKVSYYFYSMGDYNVAIFIL